MKLTVKQIADASGGKLTVTEDGKLNYGDLNADQFTYHFLTAAAKVEQDKRLNDPNFANEPQKFIASVPNYVSTAETGEVMQRHQFNVSIFSSSTPVI